MDDVCGGFAVSNQKKPHLLSVRFEDPLVARDHKSCNPPETQDVLGFPYLQNIQNRNLTIIISSFLWPLQTYIFPTKNGSPLATNLSHWTKWTLEDLMVKSKLSFFSAWAASLFCFSCLIISGKQFGCSIPCSNHHFLIRRTHPFEQKKPFKSQKTHSEISQEINFKNFCTKSSMNSAQLMEAKKQVSPRSAMEIFSPSVHLWILYSLYIWNDVAKNTKCTSLSSGNLWKFHELHQSSFWDVWFAGLPLHMLPFANQRSTEHPFSATWLCFLVPSLN